MGAKEVAAGASWLDENFPGWEREIDLGTLDIGNCQDCICGQSLDKYVTNRRDDILSGYGVALDAAGVREDPRKASTWAKAHGFTCNEDHEARELEHLWRELIKERFNTGNLSDGED